MLTPNFTRKLLPFKKCCSSAVREPSHTTLKERQNSTESSETRASLESNSYLLAKSSSKIEILSHQADQYYETAGSQQSFQNSASSCQHDTRLTSYPTVFDDIEEAIRRSTSPIPTNETEEIEILGFKGVLLNTNEISNLGNDYKLNHDPNPEIVYKVANIRPIEYEQDIQIRYLKPPTPPPPGDLIIKKQTGSKNNQTCDRFRPFS